MDTFETKLTKILTNLIDTYAHGQKYVDSEPYRPTNREEALSEIKAVFLELIGEDEVEIPKGADAYQVRRTIARNAIRAELRKKIEGEPAKWRVEVGHKLLPVRRKIKSEIEDK